MKLVAMMVLASTALIPAAAMAQGAAQPNRPAQDATARPMAASDLRGKDVYTTDGKNIGQVDAVVIGQGSQAYAVVSFDDSLNLGDESRLVPVSNIAFQNDRVILAGMAQNDIRRLTAYNDNTPGYREAPDSQQIALGSQNGQQQAQQGNDGSRIVVQQSAPTVRVNPAEPRVLVRQPQPQVTVSQAKPEILVRQPQPTVRVDIPQPEIIVRMPKPDVNVAMAQPQVQVNQPKPQVQVTQPQQPQVQVQRDANEQANVQVQEQGQPQVQFQNQGQPVVRYERAQPRVIVNQAQGQPNVKFEQMDQANADANARNQQAQAQQDNRKAQQNEAKAGQAQPSQQQAAAAAQQNQSLRERLNAGDPESTGALNANVQTRPVPISQIDGRDVKNARGEDLGKVDRVIVTPQGKRFAIVGNGGFFGIGRDRVAFPLDRFWLRGDNLVLRGVTENDIEAMDNYRDTVDNFQRMSRNQTADLRVWQ